MVGHFWFWALSFKKGVDKGTGESGRVWVREYKQRHLAGKGLKAKTTIVFLQLCKGCNAGGVLSMVLLVYSIKMMREMTGAPKKVWTPISVQPGAGHPWMRRPALWVAPAEAMECSGCEPSPPCEAPSIAGTCSLMLIFLSSRQLPPARFPSRCGETQQSRHWQKQGQSSGPWSPSCSMSPVLPLCVISFKQP